MAKKIKTNAMRQLDKEKVAYEMLSYSADDGKIDGISVAQKIGEPIVVVYKTLVTHAGKELFVFVIPVAEELSLKKAAQAAGVKKVEMLPVADLQKNTGYIRGGCSPVGMRKLYPTFVDNSAEQLELMIVSGGQIGVQMKLKPDDLLKVTQGQFVDLTQ